MRLQQVSACRGRPPSTPAPHLRHQHSPAQRPAPPTVELVVRLPAGGPEAGDQPCCLGDQLTDAVRVAGELGVQGQQARDGRPGHPHGCHELPGLQRGPKAPGGLQGGGVGWVQVWLLTGWLLAGLWQGRRRCTAHAAALRGTACRPARPARSASARASLSAACCQLPTCRYWNISNRKFPEPEGSSTALKMAPGDVTTPCSPPSTPSW
jgi:hypothetical protein